MGLCKCPKRKVTNLFCFEHRVNVCEHCLVSNHNKCIVQSYLQWLQDSDYNPNCTLCNTLLNAQDTVRLVCYAQEQSKIYPSHSYNASLNPPPNPVPPPAEDDLGGPRKNGEQNKLETVVNFTNEATRDTITLHTASSPRKIYDTRDVGHSTLGRN
ncbi:Zinc finger protein-like 1 [Liparis tanakae]|uniref:Zinc finger protein-like 1 n=1 Tax=Liparis tanakae TaxID=230148 RepID=A0A4Z2IZ41_9TELE|nr:Zinc finger protein-like 1 [Liparis tanakae]